MTATLFILMVAAFAIISGFLTEGVKKWFDNSGKTYSSNGLALVNAIVLGLLGTVAVYILLGIPFTLINIVCILVMIGVTWLGSMIGYDKIMQLITQLSALKSKEKEEE